MDKQKQMCKTKNGVMLPVAPNPSEMSDESRLNFRKSAKKGELK